MNSSFSDKINNFSIKLNGNPKTKALSGIINSHLILFDRYSAAFNEKPETKNFLIDLETSYQNLSEKDFFKQFGLYKKNKENIIKIIEIMNQLIKFLNSKFSKQIPLIEFNDFHLKTLDTAIEKIDSKIKENRQFKKMSEKISNELTLIFWLQNLQYEEVIDNMMFFREMKIFLQIFNEDIENLDKKELLDQVDEQRNQNIRIKMMDKFFYFCWSFPPPFLKSKSMQNETEENLTIKRAIKSKKRRALEEEEDDEVITNKKTNENDKIVENQDPTLKISKKKYTQLDNQSEYDNDHKVNEVKINAINKNTISEKQNDDNNFDDGQLPTIKIKKKTNIINEEEEEKKEDKTIQLKNKKATAMKDRKDCEKKISEPFLRDPNKNYNRVLKIVVKEIDSSHPQILEKNEILSFYDKYYVKNNVKHNYATPYVCKIGRNSAIKLYEAEIKINENCDFFSRKQFQFLFNDQEAFKVICTTPPPKTETAFRIIDSPFYVSEGQVINFRGDDKDCYFHIVKLSGANSRKKNNQEVEGKKKTEKIIRKNQKEDSNEDNEYEYEPISFKVHLTDLVFNHLESKVFEFNEPEFIFGEIRPFKNEVLRQFNCNIKLEKGVGWSLTCPNHAFDNKFKVLVPLANYDQLKNQEASDPRVLEKDQCIYVANFAFQIEDITYEEA